ncbi:hypothetical protein AB0D12_37565 [Streptomyces sp. NPDC048479]
MSPLSIALVGMLEVLVMAVVVEAPAIIRAIGVFVLLRPITPRRDL